MKWKNKGQEFNKDSMCISKIKEVYLFGAGHDGKMVARIMRERYTRIKIKAFLDNDSRMWGQTLDGIPIQNPNNVTTEEDVGVVVSFASEFVQKIDLQIKNMGFEFGKNAWHFEQFLSIYALYEYDELFFSSICILPTDACNLRCKGCLNFTNYITNFTFKPLEKLKEEIDLYFDCITYTGLFFISGGEPMLYSQLPELIEYIDTKYSNRMYELGIVTNGTIMPSQDIISVLKKTRIRITVDDYREALPNMRDKITEIINVYEGLNKGENLLVRSYDEWISLFPHALETIGEDELIKKYDKCHCPWQEYKDGMLYSCNYASFAANAGIVDTDINNETYSLYKNKNKKELMEFRLGFTEKGYVEFCKKCAGYMDINPYKIKAAEQDM